MNGAGKVGCLFLMNKRVMKQGQKPETHSW